MPAPIVFVHGMFMTPLCWEQWMARFSAAGHACVAPAWPAHDGAPAQIRGRHPDPELGALTLEGVLAVYEAAVRAQPEPPILIGHSMGGLVVQLLLQRGLGRSGVAIDSAPPNGVLSTAWSFLRANWPVLNPFVSKKLPYLPSPAAFRYAFCHTLPEAEANQIYERFVTPESRQVGRAALTPIAKIDFKREHAPLLFVAGELDHIIPASLNRTNFGKYKHAGSVRAFKQFGGRTHYIVGQAGWEEVADFVAGWVANPA